MRCIYDTFILLLGKRRKRRKRFNAARRCHGSKGEGNCKQDMVYKILELVNQNGNGELGLLEEIDLGSMEEIANVKT